MFQIGDLVKIKAGYSALGIVIGFFDFESAPPSPRPEQKIRVHWTDVGHTIEKSEDLVTLNANR